MVLNLVVGLGSRLLPLIVRTSTRYGARHSLRSSYNVSKRYGKLSPLAKRSIESFSSGTISSLLISGIPYNRRKTTNIKQLNFGKSMPYGYGRRRSYARPYSRYSRYPMYRRRYSSYRRRF